MRARVRGAVGLRALRVSRGITLDVLSEKTGIDKTHLSRAERGQRRLTVESLYRVATALGLDDLAWQLEPFAVKVRDGCEVEKHGGGA